MKESKKKVVSLRYLSIPEISEKYHADSSEVRKKIKSLGIRTVTAFRSKTKKSSTAITLKDFARLKKSWPSLTLSQAKDKDIPLTVIACEVAKIRKWKSPDISTVLKMCTARSIKLYKAKFGNKPLVCMSKSSYVIFIKEIGEIVRV